MNATDKIEWSDVIGHRLLITDSSLGMSIMEVELIEMSKNGELIKVKNNIGKNEFWLDLKKFRVKIIDDLGFSSYRICEKPDSQDELAKMREENVRYRNTLRRISKWFGEFPPTGKFWADGKPSSYGSEYGSNGERDYMRQLADTALASNG